jgi:glycosyltransferase involved in cell wall biosynthesis
MHILIVHDAVIPVTKYGGTERVIWYLGKCLVQMGHRVSYLVAHGSHCDFADIIFWDKTKSLAAHMPADVDLVHAQFQFDVEKENLGKPVLCTQHGNTTSKDKFYSNTVFVSQNHAARHGATAFVHNGMDWNDYAAPTLNKKNYFHFLGDARWRVKNVRGAIDIVTKAQQQLVVLGGERLNFSMGFRFTPNLNVAFKGMVGGAEKFRWLDGSKGLVFPVLWHEPFGIAITESLFYGCPVFGSAYGALPELIQAEVGIAANSYADLIAGVSDAGRFSAQDCHDYAVDLFGAQTMAKKYVNYYETVLNGGTLNAVEPCLLESQTVKFLPMF